MNFLIYGLLLLLGYLYGSIPFALVIGKLFYNVDIRNSGSGNLGGTNAGRVLGKKAGVSVIVLDASKCVITMALASLIASNLYVNTDIVYYTGLACVFGHCYPVFANFKGGKAVSTAMGFILMVDWKTALIALAFFFVILKISKYVSLASIIASTSVLIASPFLNYGIHIIIPAAGIIFLLVFKHKENIIRIKNGTERKISWM